MFHDLTYLKGMPVKLDRELQMEILSKLADCYPQKVSLGAERAHKDPVTANAWYLEEHGLIECVKSNPISEAPVVIAAKITNRGLDFLADDGGLGAILGVVTIKIHDETLKALVAQKIEQSNLPPADKGLWLDALRKLPAEATKHLAVKLMDLGLSHAPDVIPWVGTLLGFQR